MDNTNISNAGLFQSNDAFVDSGDGYGTIILYVIVFIVVAVFVAHYAGYNVFAYLGNLTNSAGEQVMPLWNAFLEKVGYATEETSPQQTLKLNTAGTGASEDADEVEEDADGNNVDSSNANDTASAKKKTSGKSLVDNSASVEEETITSDEIDDVGENEVVTRVTRDETITTKNVKKNLKKALDSSQPTQTELRMVEENKYKPNDMFSESTHPKPSSNKNGWCYIGNYSGYRSCSKVGDADICMSGNIFPTQDICVNPSLRA